MSAPRILIVDDNRELAENLAELVAIEGAEPTIYDDPLAVMRDLATLRYEAALLDVRMPGMDGVELCRALHARHPAAKHLLMSAFLDGERADAARRCAAVVLDKPFEPATLIAQLRTLAVL